MKQSKRTRLQSRLNSLLSLVLVLALFGLIAWASTQYTIERDWTRVGRHTLSDASIQLLDQLEQPISITAYARDDKQLRDAIKNFVDRYQRIKPDISLNFINPELVPDQVRELGISVNGELIVEYGERSEHVKNISEESLTNAMQRLARGAERLLVFMNGHGERSPLKDANHDLSAWAQQLETSGFRIQSINFNSTRSLPHETSVLVLAGPEIDLFPGEIEVIREHIDNGGNLLWLSDPGEQHGLEQLTSDLGIKLQPGVVIDFAGQMLGINDPTMVLTTPGLYGDSPITEGFDYASIYPLAGGIAPVAGSEWTATPFVTSGDHTWLETGELTEEVSFDQASEQQGPITIALTLTRELEQGDQRIAVVADGDFLSNTYYQNGGNLELGNRIVNWLSADDELISIPSNTTPDTSLQLSNTAAIIIGFGFLLVLPSGLFAAGLIIWWRRRKR